MWMMTQMASNPRLTKNWIQYLKNNQIVNLKSDPNTGRLNYRRPVTAEDLFKFLDASSNLGEEKIMNAIRTVLAKKAFGKQPNRINKGQQDNPQDNPVDVDAKEVTPGNVPPTLSGKQNPKISHNPNSISDIDHREVPVQRRDPRALPPPSNKDDEERKPKLRVKHTGSLNGKPHFQYKGLKEDFQDEQGEELDEKDIEEVFSLLLSQQTYDTDTEETPANNRSNQNRQQNKPQQANNATTQQTSPEQDLAKNEESLGKIKRVVRDTMSPDQRKSLWRALNEHLAEAHITSADVKEILKGASALKNNSGIMGRMLKGLRKDKLDINDLQRAWKEAGFPDDTRDIYAILKNQFGFGDKEIRKVFAQVFGSTDDETGYKTPAGSRSIQNIANYAKQHGIDGQLRDFMKQEFGEELGLEKPGLMSKIFGKEKKAVAEEVRQIFTAMVQEERTGRPELIRQQEYTQLGRTRK